MVGATGCGLQQGIDTGRRARGREFPAGLVSGQHLPAFEQGAHTAGGQAILGDQGNPPHTVRQPGKNLGSHRFGFSLAATHRQQL
jgi:hypothetical protein